MADPKIKFKRSSVQGKQPGASDLPLGELALNTYDGRAYISKSTNGGISTSVVNLSGVQIENAGTNVGYANTLNFVGSGVTVSVVNGVSIVNVTSSSGAVFNSIAVNGVYMNSNEISTNTNIPANNNAFVIGPIGIVPSYEVSIGIDSVLLIS